MGRLSKYIGSQFGNPRGFVGKICCYFMNRINQRMYHEILLNLEYEKNVLDVGYGNGYLVQKMYRKTSAQIDGIDISEDMKLVASIRNLDGINEGKIHLTTGDCCNLQYKNQTFDAVTTVNTIYFWNDTMKGLCEILRTLKDNGVFYNAVYSKKWMTKTSYTKEGFNLYEKDEYVQMAKQAGFTEVTVSDIIIGKSFLIKCRK